MPTKLPTAYVPCAQCGNEIDARRAALPISHGRCVPCNAPFLKDSRCVREGQPTFETADISRAAANVEDLRPIWRDERGLA